MKYIFLLCVATCIGGFLNANPEQVSLNGTLQDAQNKEFIAFAKVVLLDTSGKLLGGAETNEKGFFEIKTNPGYFRLRIIASGYSAFTRKIIVTEKGLSMGIVSLSTAVKEMKEVDVVAEKSAIQRDMERQVINVDKNLVSQGGTASDVLQTVPGVSLDNDGKIQLRGTSNLNVLIDGKPTGTRGSNVNTILEQIPASSIDNIEVMTNPSAKYDPSGTGGIINIVTKRNKQKGISGQLSFTWGTRNKYNAGGAFNYRNKHINLSLNMSYINHMNIHRSEFTSNNYPSDTSFKQYNISNARSFNATYLPKIGLDVFASDKTTLFFNLSATFNRNDESNRVLRQFKTSEDVLANGSVRLSSNKFIGNFYDASIGFRHNFKGEKHNLTGDISYIRNMDDNRNPANEYYYSIADPSLPDFLQDDSIFTGQLGQTGNLKLDYTKGFKNKSYMEFGYAGRLNFVKRDLRFLQTPIGGGDWYIDSNRSNTFKYREDVHAVYGTYNGTYSIFSYKVGLRFETTLMNGKLLETSQSFDQKYFSFFPSVQMRVDLGKESSFNIGYSRRINRPNPNQLNPFGDYTDPRNVRSGNPALKPEFSHSFESGYIKNWEKLTITLNAYYRLQTGMITFVRRVDERGFGRLSFENIGTAHNYGLEYNLRYSPFKWWNFSIDLNAGEH